LSIGWGLGLTVLNMTKQGGRQTMKKTVAVGFLVVLVGVAYALSGCSKSPEHGAGAAVTQGIAVLYPTQGNKVQGVVTFVKEKDGVHVVASIDGLSPGLHGFHIHELGDCSSPDGNSAGGHFNPMNMPHAGPVAEKRHEGDLGNLQADASGKAKLAAVDPKLSFEGANSIIGRSVVVHAQPDDFTTQPTGASGPRVACGVIGVMK
jgi:Cu-Zn family superoxide dismutase